jgi:hypothetical protein
VSIETVDRLIAEAFPNIPGWCSIAKGQRMARLVVEAGARSSYYPSITCVELGVFGGRGMLALGLAVKHCRLQGTVDGIDPFTKDASLEGKNTSENDNWWSKLDYEAIYNGAKGLIAQHGLDAIVRLLRQRSQDAARAYGIKTIDVLHQDANHSETTSCLETALYAPAMQPGGFWVADDTNWPTTQRAHALLVERHGFVKVEDYDSWAVYRAP